MNGVDYTSYFLNYNRLYNLFDNSSLTCSNTSEFLYPGQSVTLTFKNTIPSIIKEGVKNITIAFETNNSNSNDAYTVKAATTLTISNEINRESNGQHKIGLWTQKNIFNTGEQIPVSLKAVRTEGQDYGPATPSEGYQVLVTVNYPEGSYITSFNPTYNANSGYWEGTYSATYSGGIHILSSQLYCTNKNLACGKYVTNTLDKILATGNKTTLTILQSPETTGTLTFQNVGPNTLPPVYLVTKKVATYLCRHC